MTIAAPQSTSAARFPYRAVQDHALTRVVPPAEVWEPSRRQARVSRGNLGIEHTATAIRTLRPRIENDDHGSGIGSSKPVVRNRNSALTTLTAHRRSSSVLQDLHTAPLTAASTGGTTKRSERWANAFAGSLVGLVLAAGIALFGQPEDTQPPVPAGVTPDFTVSQSAH